MNYLEQLQQRQNQVRDGLRHLVDLETQDDEQRTVFDWLDAEDRWLTTEIADEERRETTRTTVRDRLADGTVTAVPGSTRHVPNINTATSPYDVLEDRTADRGSLRDAAIKVLEDKVTDPERMENARAVIDRHLRSKKAGIVEEHWARGLIARTHPDYVSAFETYLTSPTAPLWTPEEVRALAVGTNTQGGFLTPTHLDPTIILTNTGSANVIRSISRVVTLVEGDTWNGVTSAGATASWDAELAEVSDDSPELGNPSIPVYKGQAFISASVEAFQDIAGLTSEVLMLFADAMDRLQGAAHATGSGSGQPTGIFTALDANTNVEITSTTAATIGEVDLHSLYRQVGQRWRGRATWLMHPLFGLAIKRLGTAVSSSYSGDLTTPITDRILGRPLVESDDAPSTQTTTALDNEIVFGDFSNYVIVDKPGSTSVEFVPHLFGTTNGRPIGARGWVAWFRSGADSVNDVAFRLLLDKTSA